MMFIISGLHKGTSFCVIFVYESANDSEFFIVFLGRSIYIFYLCDK